jgi:hypothetical protein
LGGPEHFNDGTGLDVLESKKLMVLFHLLDRNELILSTSFPCFAGGSRALRRAIANGVPSTPGRLGYFDQAVDVSDWQIVTVWILLAFKVILAVQWGGFFKLLTVEARPSGPDLPPWKIGGREEA